MKTLILKNNINNELDEAIIDAGLAKVQELLKSIDFVMELNVVKTNKLYTSVPFVGATSDVKSGYQIDPKQILGEEKKYGNHDIVCLFFDPTDIKPVAPINPTDNTEVIQMPSDWYGEDNINATKQEKIDTFVVFFLHELCHERFWALNKKDTTHDFYTSKFAQEQNGLVKYYLYLLSLMKPPKPIIPKKNPEVVLTRKSDDGIQTLGELTFGDFKCKTLERPYKGNKNGISCVPKGIYSVKYTFSPKFLKYTYQLVNVPKRSGIRIHSASFWHDLEGCIALGSDYKYIDKDKQIDIINSRKTIQKFEELLNKKDFTLIIM